jgi:hypothetical protein
MTVLEHILACDVERTALLKELEELIASEDEPATKKGGKNQKGKKGGASSKTMRLAEVNERLEIICANDQETKAIEILTGIGFS